MPRFLAVIIGIILIIGVILSVPLGTYFMGRSAEELEHFVRWRILGVLVLLVGVGFAVLAFVVLSRLVR